MITYMDKFRVVVLNEPRYYREVIASALSGFRPDIEVMTAGPELLGHELVRLDPDMVVCSNATSEIRGDGYAWVEIYRDEEPHAIAYIDGHSSVVTDIELDDLLSIIDRAEKVWQAKRLFEA